MNLIFLGNGRCYHTMDWFRSAQALYPSAKPFLVTDLIEGESFEKLIKDTDEVKQLIVLDKYLFNKQSRVGNMWRNLLKLFMLPIQVIKFRALLKQHKHTLIHAHSMYYIMIARFSSCPYIATPQGSEILVRPFRSRAYRLFAKISLKQASTITVDSKSMQRALDQLFVYPSKVIQNGIDIETINQLNQNPRNREWIVSIRALAPNYQIDKLINYRNAIKPNLPLTFCYPFIEQSYRDSLIEKLSDLDKNLGRISRQDLYQLLFSTKLVISIPLSDSSPRSVYEAIFCGCIVATTKAAWIDDLPQCMVKRLIIIDIESDTWLDEAIVFAEQLKHEMYKPSSEALSMFNQKESMRIIVKELI